MKTLKTLLFFGGFLLFSASSIYSQSVYEGDYFSGTFPVDWYDGQGSSGDNSFNRITSVSDWASASYVDENTIRIYGTPGSSSSSDDQITVTWEWTNSGKMEPIIMNSEQTFTINVKENSAPNITSTPDEWVAEGSRYSYNLSATDADGDPVSFSLISAPSWLSISGNTVYGTPGLNDSGNYTVEIRASDNNPGYDKTDSQTYTLTVGNTNQAPAFTSTGVTTGKENEFYSYSITTSDPDGDNVSISAVQIPTFLSLTDNGDGTGSLSGTPNFNQAGTYEITLRISDGSDYTDQQYVITVDNNNRLPSIGSSPVTNATEGQTYSYDIITGDPDNEDVTLSIVQAPSFLSLTGVTPSAGTATLTGTPGLSDAGTYTVELQATDESGGTDSQTYTLTVSNTNQAPAITSTAVTTGQENSAYSYTVTTSEPDGDNVSISAVSIPSFLSLTDNGDGTATLSGTPNFSQAGSYPVEIQASDGSLTDSQTFDLVIAETNRAPTITSTAVNAGQENNAYSYTITTSDPDGQAVSFAAIQIPSFLSFADNGDGTATLSGTPNFSQAGSYPIEIQASDGSLTDSQTFDLVIAETNRNPEITSTAVTSASEGINYAYNITTSDLDGHDVTLSVVQAPAFLDLVMVDPVDGTARLQGTPGYSDAGTYTVEILATDSGNPNLTDSQQWTITVSNTNQSPTITTASIPGGVEGRAYSTSFDASDPDDQPVSFSGIQIPSFLNFVDNGDGTASLTGTPSYTDEGSYTVEIQISDGTDSSTETYTLQITGDNAVPEFTSTPVTDGKEDQLYSYSVTVNDKDGDPISISAVQIPIFLSLTHNGDGTALLEGTPDYNEAGTYEITLRASDGKISNEQRYVITVSNTNRGPAITSSEVTSATEGQKYTYSITTADPDGNSVTVSLGQAPSWLSLTNVNPSTGTATLEGTPSLSDRGTYTIRLVATDNGSPALTDSQEFTLTVSNTNQAPVFTSEPDSAANETDDYGYVITTSDADGDPVTITAVNIPSFLTLTDNGDGTATLAGYLDYSTQGSYQVELAVSDGTLTGSQSFTLEISGTNRQPEITSTAKNAGQENSAYSYTITTSDPDGDNVSISAVSIPGFLSLADNGDGTATLSGTPNFSQAGSYPVEIQASDGSLKTSQSFDLVIANSNRNPVITSTADSTAIENQSYSYTITTSDPDGNNVSISAVQIPSFLSLTDNGDGTATLSGSPGLSDQGSYEIKLLATDNGNPNLTDSQQWTITVSNTNQAPEFTSTPVTTGKETETYSYQVTTSDADGNSVSISILQAPGWLSLVGLDEAAGTATLEGTPTYRNAGSYSIKLQADDGNATTTQTYTLTIEKTNKAPVIQSEPAGSTPAEVQYEYIVIATDSTDLFSDQVSFSATLADGSALPDFISLKDVSSPSGEFHVSLTGTPSPADVGSYDIEILASDGSLTDSQSFTLTVTQGNQPPVITSNPITGVTASYNYSYTVTTDDVDGDQVTITAGQIPSFLSLTDHADGTATLSGTPSESQAGSYQIKLVATDNGNPQKTDSQSFTLTVSENNHEPVIVSTPPDASSSEGAVTTSIPSQIEFSYVITVADTSDSINGDVSIFATLKGSSDLPGFLSLKEVPTEKPNIFKKELSGTPSPDDMGSYDIVITAEDQGGMISKQSFTLVVEQGNRQPLFTSDPEPMVRIGQPYSYKIVASDPDSMDTISYSVEMADGSQLPAWISFTASDSTALLEGTPKEEDMGSYTFIITASDNGTPQKERTQRFTLDVKYKTVTELKALYNYPNPARRATKIKFELPARDQVYLQVFSTTGALVRETAPQTFDAGVNVFDFQVRGLASGIYIYRIVSTGDYTSGRMTIIR